MPNRVLLCDFGVSAMLPSNASKRTTFIGTPYWMAPEVITTGASYDYKADIWSFGITVLEMANGEPPMSGQDARRAIMLIPKQRAPRLEGGTWSREMREFVTGCLNEEPADVSRCGRGVQAMSDSNCLSACPPASSRRRRSFDSNPSSRSRTSTSCWSTCRNGKTEAT